MSTTLCHLGNIAYRVGRSVKFDGATERFVGDEEADTLLSRAYRAPYVLPLKTWALGAPAIAPVVLFHTRILGGGANSASSRRIVEVIR